LWLMKYVYAAAFMALFLLIVMTIEKGRVSALKPI